MTDWLSQLGIGSDVRAYDRRLGSAVVSSSHPFALASDLTIENGLLRVRCGNDGLLPHVNVEAFRSGAWRDCGSVLLAAQGSDSRLAQAHLVRLTPDDATLHIVATLIGDIYVTLLRGERMLRIVVGSNRLPLAPGTQTVRWQGLPPAYTVELATNGTGRYGNGLSLSAGVVTVLWPPVQRESDWAIAVNWTPPSASTSQANQRLWRVIDEGGTQSVLCEWVASSRTFRATIGAATVSSPAQTFSAGTPVHVNVRHSDETGTTLTAYPVGGTVSHTLNAAMIASGTASGYHRIQLGENAIQTPVFGDDDFGDGTFGPTIVTAGVGVMDNLMIIEDSMSDAEASTLATSASALGGIPSPEGRLAWHAAFDAAPLPAASALASGRRVASSADANGLTRCLLGLRSDLTTPVNFGLSGSVPFEVGAGLATVGSYDTVTDLHNQFASEWRQRTGVRL